MLMMDIGPLICYVCKPELFVDKYNNYVKHSSYFNAGGGQCKHWDQQCLKSDIVLKNNCFYDLICFSVTIYGGSTHPLSIPRQAIYGGSTHSLSIPRRAIDGGSTLSLSILMQATQFFMVHWLCWISITFSWFNLYLSNHLYWLAHSLFIRYT